MGVGRSVHSCMIGAPTAVVREGDDSWGHSHSSTMDVWDGHQTDVIELTKCARYYGS